LTQGLSVSPETPGILDICVDEETGTILNMKLSSAKKSSFGENVILEYTIVSFSNNVLEDTFLFPATFQ